MSDCRAANESADRAMIVEPPMGLRAFPGTARPLPDPVATRSFGVRTPHELARDGANPPPLTPGENPRGTGLGPTSAVPPPPRRAQMARAREPALAFSPSDAAPSSGLGFYARHALAGGMCASITHTVLVPMDVIKTRMQLHPETYKSLGESFSLIRAKEGARALLAGLVPTTVGYLIQGGLKFGAFQAIKDVMKPIVGPQFAHDHPTLFYLACSGPAEVIASTALCPIEAVRIRMVASSAFASSLGGGLARIYGEEGVYGLYKGLTPILFKQVPYTMVQLTAFSLLTDYIYAHLVKKESLSKSQQLAVTVGAGAVAGAISSLASQPGDTILTRINKAAKAAAAGGTVVKPSVLSTYQSLGFRGLWLGAGTRMVMTAILSGGMFLIFDSVKLAVGLPTSG